MQGKGFFISGENAVRGHSTTNVFRLHHFGESVRCGPFSLESRTCSMTAWLQTIRCCQLALGEGSKGSRNQTPGLIVSCGTGGNLSPASSDRAQRRINPVRS